MTPILRGRLQTRLLLTFIIGLPAAWLTTSLRPSPGGLIASLVTSSLVVMAGAIVGLAWESLYHGLQQLRHDRDWPSLFGLAAGLPEGLVLGAAIATVDASVHMSRARFVITWTVVWTAIWVANQSLARVLEPRWRYAGNRFTVRDLSRADTDRNQRKEQ